MAVSGREASKTSQDISADPPEGVLCKDAGPAAARARQAGQVTVVLCNRQSVCSLASREHPRPEGAPAPRAVIRALRDAVATPTAT